MLIDSGSTSSFIDVNTATKLNCVMEEDNPWIITVADGGKTTNKFKCNEFKWLMQREPFTADLRVLQHGGCDVILGAYLMWEHSPIIFNLKNNKIRSWKDEKEVILEEDSSKQEMRVITTRGLDNFLHKTTHGVTVKLFNENTETQHDGECDDQILAVLAKYEEIFIEPKGLPPKRRIEHEINLKPKTQPIF